VKWAEWLEIPAIQRRKTIRFNWIRFAVDVRVMQANLNKTISAPAGASYGVESPVVVTPPPKNVQIAALEPAPAGSRVGGEL